MTDIKKVCVTGGAGYLGSWIVKFLLDRGYDVNATVRNINGANTEHLNKDNLSPNSTGSLTLYEADLLQPNSFDMAIDGCDAVIHCASPFSLNKEKDKDKFIQPAVEGTKNVLGTVSKFKSVKHVIQTSSIVAISNVASDTKVYTENDWEDPKILENMPYQLSKLEAEKTAWNIAHSQNDWQLTTINPSLIVGPALSSRVNDGSIGTIKSILQGKYFFAIQISMPMVDVRDVAMAHINAMENSNVSMGKRFICCCDSLYLIDVGKIIAKKYSNKFWFLPRFVIPNTLLWAVTPMLPFPKDMLNIFVGKPVRFSNNEIREELGINFMPLEQSLDEMVENMIKNKLV